MIGMVIGDYPGAKEEETGLPFTGRSGVLTKNILAEIGIDPETLRFDYTMSERGTGKFSSSEIKEAARSHLQPLIQEHKPEVVLILGNTTLTAILGRKGQITKLEGTTIVKDGVTYVPCRSPSSVVRAEGEPGYQFLVQKFRENLLLFRSLIQPERVASSFQFEKWEGRGVPQFEKGRPVFLDIESNGLSPFRPDARIWCMAIGQTPDTVRTVVLKEQDFPAYRRFLEEYEIVAHRATFEGMWLWRILGVFPKIYYDTKVGAFIRNENDPTGLKYQAIKELGVDPWVEEMDFQNPDFDVILPYNARDTSYMNRLYLESDLPHLRKFPKKARLLKYITFPAIEIFTKAICKGFCIDMGMAREKLETCRGKEQEFNDRIDEYAGRHVNPGSPKQMAKFLYEDLRLKCPVLTDKGAKSTSEAALIRLMGGHPVIDTVLEWRKWKKFDSSYLTPWIAQGPILHANYGFTDTVTGRLNSKMVKNRRNEKKKGGTLHQCPRDGFIRNLVTTRGHDGALYYNPGEGFIEYAERSEDWCVVAADLSQIELRLVAQAANEPEMIRIFRNGTDPSHIAKYHNPTSKFYRGDKCFDCDIHLGTAQSLQRGEIDKETRKKAKAVNFGFVYGMWAPKFVRYAKEKFALNLSLREGENFRETFFGKYEGLLPWHRRVEAFVTRNGWIESLFGRRRNLPNAKLDSEAEEWMRRAAVREGINSPIQSAGSDLCLLIAVLIGSPRVLWPVKLDNSRAFLIGSAHDSQLYECRREYVKELRDIIFYTAAHINEAVRRYFNFEFKIPITMDVEAYDKHWELKEERIEIDAS
jgi:uracil-DNA glycosylase family 4